MSDLISRQAAIGHLKKRLYETALNNYPNYSYYEEIADNRVDTWLNEVPAAQPESEERKAESAQNVPIEDLIERQAAIEALGKEGLITAMVIVDRVPSAQPEWEELLVICDNCGHAIRVRRLP